ncbi:MAG: hypothetical protein ABIO70_00055 [Pseudomonadota bacterium]
MISSDHLPTFTAVALGAGILALLLAAFALREARVAGVGALGVMDGATSHQEQVDHQLKALEARVQALEAAPKPVPVPVEAPAEPAPAE